LLGLGALDRPAIPTERDIDAVEIGTEFDEFVPAHPVEFVVRVLLRRIAAAGDTPKKYTDDELDRMSRDELVELGTNLDGVDVAFRRDRWAVEGTKAEK